LIFFSKHVLNTTMDEDEYYGSDEEYESEEEVVEEEVEEEEAVDILDEDIEKEEDREEEEDEPADDDEDMSEYFESAIIPTYDEKDTKPFLSTIEEITHQATKNRRTLPILSKYEKAKIIGIRAQQISMGSYIYLDNLETLSNPLDVAKEELRQKRTPLLIRRNIVGKKGIVFEDWRIEELIDPHEDL
jgi:DNA-directed RNA polymerase I, II, and III subunit RPABC2